VLGFAPAAAKQGADDDVYVVAYVCGNNNEVMLANTVSWEFTTGTGL
jgi:hypothetical protein